MNVIEIDQMSALRECVQQLAVQVARLSQAVEPLVRVQEEQNRLRDRIAELEGFRTALLWLTGVLGTSAAVRYFAMLWLGGGHIH